MDWDNVIFSCNQKVVSSQNFLEKLDKIQKVINIWNMRGLSLFGIVTIVKTFLIPKLLYISSIIQTPMEIIIKGSLSSSWMNSPIPSLLLPLLQNESLCETIGMKIYVTCTFIRVKIKSFSCETFSTSTRSKEANGNSEVEVNSTYAYACAKRSTRPARIPVSVACD